MDSHGTAVIVICPTCGARLRVRQQNVFGQIYPCPKCRSMVQIPEAPPASLPLALATPGSPLGVKDPGNGPQDVEKSRDFPPDIPPLRLPETARSVSWLRWGTALGCGLVLGLGLAAGLFFRLNPSVDVVRQIALDSEVSPKDKNASSEDSPSKNSPSENSLRVKREDRVPPKESQDLPDSGRSATPLGEGIGEGIEKEASSPDPTLPPRIAPHQPSPSMSASPASVAMLPPDATLRVEALDGETSMQIDRQVQKPVIADPPGLEVIERTGIDPGLAEPSPTGSGRQSRPVLTPLEFQIRGAHFENITLASFIDRLTQLVGVPLQIEPDALIQAGGDAGTEIHVETESETTAGGLLTSVLEPLRLRVYPVENAIRISHPIYEDQELKTIRFEVQDLINGSADFDFPAVIRLLIEPQQWQPPARVELKEGALIVHQVRRVQLQILVMLERLRGVRGIPTQTKLPSRYLAQGTRWEAVEARLSRLVDVNAWHPQPVLEVISQIGSECGVQILMDWNRLASVGWTPSTKVRLALRRTPAREALRAMFVGEALEIRPLTATSVQVTTRDADLERPYLDFYSLRQLNDDELLELESPSNQGGTRFALDPGSDAVLVVMSAAEHEKLHRSLNGLKASARPR